MGEGISIFELSCAIQHSKTICAHIERYYKSAVGLPRIYCLFDYNIMDDFKSTNSIIDKFEFNQIVSSYGDICHYDIVNMNDKIGEKFTKFCINNKYIYLCEGDSSTLINQDEHTHEFFSNARNIYEESLSN